MDMLRTKLKLFKELAYEHKSSLQTVDSVKNVFEGVVDHVERQIVMRAKEKLTFKTKIGVSVRESMLELMNKMAGMVHEVYCSAEEIYRQLLERQLSIQEVIKHGDPLIREIDYLSEWISQTNLKYATTTSAIKTHEESRLHHQKIKQMIHSESLNYNKENMRGQNLQKSRGQSGHKYELNMLMIAREGSEGFLKASHKLKQFQIMELSLVVDECLNYVGDMTFMKKQITTPLIKSQENKPKVDRELFGSLGIESMRQQEEQIDLLCDEHLTITIPLPKKSMSQDLQRITERQQQLQSDQSPSQLKTYGRICPTP